MLLALRQYLGLLLDAPLHVLKVFPCLAGVGRQRRKPTIQLGDRRLGRFQRHGDIASRRLAAGDFLFQLADALAQRFLIALCLRLLATQVAFRGMQQPRPAQQSKYEYRRMPHVGQPCLALP